MTDWPYGPGRPCPPGYATATEQVNLKPVMMTQVLSPEQQEIVTRLDRLIQLGGELLAATKPGSRLSNTDLTLAADTVTQLSAMPKATRSVVVQAHSGNTDVVLVGGPQISPSQGYPLAAGQSIPLPIDDLSKVYAYCRVTATISYLAVLP